MKRSLSALVCLCLAGCATAAVGVKRVDPQTVQRNLTASVLTSGEPTFETRNVLERHNLTQRFAEAPDDALASLHALALAENDDDAFFALAELAFLQGERSRDRRWHLAAALYAYAFLFGGHPPGRFDPRLRVATDVYNRGLTEGFATPEGDVAIRPGTFPLPFGTLDVAFDAASLEWGGRRFRRFIPAAELEVHGLRSRFRRPGIGAPLAADASVENPDTSNELVAPRLKVPVTALLRVENLRGQLARGHVQGTLELYSDPYDDSVRLAGATIPLEREHTATIAAMLADAPMWKMELAAFLGSVSARFDSGKLIALRPHRAGGIPVVFVHGTNSSPGRWAEMGNVLENDPRIHARFEPWFFFYNSGSPILYSSYLLRKKLIDTVASLDPPGADRCLRDMVIVGHSQGGLLAKMTVVRSGDTFWKSVSRKSIDEIQASREERRFLREMSFVRPLPFVKRVVFIATPQRGSFIAAGQLVRSFIAQLVRLPRTMADVTTKTVLRNPDAVLVDDLENMTAVDNMAPGHRFIRNLAKLPVAPGVAAHSIIAVEGTGPVEEGDDGVVAYKSAHIDGVQSEKVVRSGHSTQSNPETIEEVRRILMLHLAQSTCLE